MKLDGAATAALLRDLEAGRRGSPVLEDLDLDGVYTWKRGIAGATFRRVRLAWTTIRPGLLGRRPSFSGWILEDCRLERVVAKRADFVDVSARGLLLSGPFEAFADCRFTDCVLEDLTIPSRLRFEDCSFVNVQMAVASPDNLVFVRCLFERSAMSGNGTVSFVDCRFRDADLSGLNIWNSALNASAEADARLPQTRDCFFVPAAALEGPLYQPSSGRRSATRDCASILRPSHNRRSS